MNNSLTPKININPCSHKQKQPVMRLAFLFSSSILQDIPHSLLNIVLILNKEVNKISVDFRVILFAFVVESKSVTN